jgi:hypothetical protein
MLPRKQIDAVVLLEYGVLCEGQEAGGIQGDNGCHRKDQMAAVAPLHAFSSLMTRLGASADVTNKTRHQ